LWFLLMKQIGDNKQNIYRDIDSGRKSHRDNEFSRILNDGCPVVWNRVPDDSKLTDEFIEEFKQGLSNATGIPVGK